MICFIQLNGWTSINVWLQGWNTREKKSECIDILLTSRCCSTGQTQTHAGIHTHTCTYTADETFIPLSLKCYPDSSPSLHPSIHPCLILSPSTPPLLNLTCLKKETALLFLQLGWGKENISLLLLILIWQHCTLPFSFYLISLLLASARSSDMYKQSPSHSGSQLF